eukprot:7385657-Prymnesium_polylepis.1
MALVADGRGLVEKGFGFEHTAASKVRTPQPFVSQPFVSQPFAPQPTHRGPTHAAPRTALRDCSPRAVAAGVGVHRHECLRVPLVGNGQSRVHRGRRQDLADPRGRPPHDAGCVRGPPDDPGLRRGRQGVHPRGALGPRRLSDDEDVGPARGRLLYDARWTDRRCAGGLGQALAAHRGPATCGGEDLPAARRR